MVFNWFKKNRSTQDEASKEDKIIKKETPVATDFEKELEELHEEAISPSLVQSAKNKTDELLATAEDVPEKFPPIIEDSSQIIDQDIAEKELNESNSKADEKQKKPSYFGRLKQGLSKTRNGFSDVFFGKKQLDDDLIDDLEMQLLISDVGIEVTNRIISEVTEKVARRNLTDAKAVKISLEKCMVDLLSPYEKPLLIANHRPFVILMIGINGAGKTTTIGKLANHFKNEGKKVMLAAGDTFRAAAVEQLQAWGERNSIPVIAQKTGADSASVAYDALQSAKARGVDVLIIDTAGRLHTQDNLMEELKKVKRVLQKIDIDVPHEIMLVIDAGNGQNALKQAQIFNEAMAITGITLTKLDGTAKGGIIFAITDKLHLPIRFIGVGENSDDLRPFNAKLFVDALLYNE